MYPDGATNRNFEDAESAHFFTTPYQPFDNWSAHRVKLWGREFATVEHGYHWRKFSETAPDVAELVLEAPSAWATWQISREHAKKRRPDWDEVKIGIMRELLVAKLEQNEDVRERLAASAHKTIIEDSPWDSFWGLGPKGDGENMMGRLWMELREGLVNV